MVRCAAIQLRLRQTSVAAVVALVFALWWCCASLRFDHFGVNFSMLFLQQAFVVTVCLIAGKPLRVK